MKQKLMHRHRLYVLNYHQVSPAFDPEKNTAGVWTSLADFREDILFLRSNFRILPLEQAARDLKKGSLRGFNFVITLDDGHRSLLETVVPLVQREQVPISVFLNSGHVKHKALRWSEASRLLRKSEDPAKTEQAVATARSTLSRDRYVSTVGWLEGRLRDSAVTDHAFLEGDDIAKLEGDFVTIGLHGHLHHRHAMFDEEWQRWSLKENFAALKKHKNFVPYLAVPFGKPIDWNESTLRICGELELTPLFHNGGYNLPGAFGGRRIPSDGRRARDLIEGQSPRLALYDAS